MSFQVPISPLAPMIPPKAHRIPPLIAENKTIVIPKPPLGGRYPGDRMKWKPLEVKNSQVQEDLSRPDEIDV
jgi:hypothetical protein